MPQTLEKDDWEESLTILVQAVAWLDGTARRAKVSGDSATLIALQDYIESQLLPCFCFELSSRVKWDGAYYIPEIISSLYCMNTSLISIWIVCQRRFFSFLEPIEKYHLIGS